MSTHRDGWMRQGRPDVSNLAPIHSAVWVSEKTFMNHCGDSQNECFKVQWLTSKNLILR